MMVKKLILSLDSPFMQEENLFYYMIFNKIIACFEVKTAKTWKIRSHHNWFPSRKLGKIGYVYGWVKWKPVLVSFWHIIGTDQLSVNMEWGWWKLAGEVFSFFLGYWFLQRPFMQTWCRYLKRALYVGSRRDVAPGQISNAGIYPANLFVPVLPTWIYGLSNSHPKSIRNLRKPLICSICQAWRMGRTA